MEDEFDNGLRSKIETVRNEIINLQNPGIPIMNPEMIDLVLREALTMDSPTINMASIICPNWGIGEDGERTILPMDDSLPRIEQFFGVDLNELRLLFDEHGISTNTLIIVSDIVEKSWVDVSNTMFEQNRKYVAGYC
ncbi:MAG TPA: hypothetical protein PK957_02925 [Candidatus Dojkabacteria bacterium]|nr:hypothetical protein [Candidatus Dojkabacteria bacterium]HQF36506.1 hypothetical protein [Candidatus Dojkabacteria bacterium]